MKVHPTAIVHPDAKIADDVEIGPYCIINEHVTIGPGNRLVANVYIDSWSDIGANNEIHVGAIIGYAPQHLNYKGGRGFTKIGNDNIIREYVTIHRSFLVDQSTVIGDKNFIMATAHIGHDCVVGNKCILANGSLVAGHVIVQDCVYISGNVGIHQFVRIGTLAMVGGLARVSKDVLPYSIVEGNSFFRGINIVGLRRAGYDQKRRSAIEQAYRTLFWRHLNTKDALNELDNSGSADVRQIIDFIHESKRGFCRPKPGHHIHDDISEDDPDDDDES